ncbi:hypothetical protein FFI94_015705 [Rhodococcus sp. KBS0724]|jgi:hypothetical protein|uniref:hypothetical protein n=1 Tax=Rhodococcus sp. KBS0724 TaxID=1179674 RepID=UPI00110E811B|nr:hypothetical protein [Rhodococcus sp. KBS0724]TSD47457.1 hypothetical protein FFI94_015705 [Rhodococcus sp. KBS0724]
MDRYRITMPDGSTTDELFESDNEAISAAIQANLGASQGITVERYTNDGELLATHLPEGGYRRQ